MGRIVLGVATALSLVALVLASFGVATNHWVRLHRPDGKMNPVEVNQQMAFTTVKYPARYLGLWYGCYRYVGRRCGAGCWQAVWGGRGGVARVASSGCCGVLEACRGGASRWPLRSGGEVLHVLGLACRSRH